MKLQGSLFFICLFFAAFAYSQDSDLKLVKLAIQKTEQAKVFSYSFNVYFKSVGVADMPKPWMGFAYVSPDTFVCQYTSWAGRACDYYSIRIGDSVIRYFFYPDKKQFDWVKTNKEQFAPHSGFNCYSTLAQMGKPVYYVNGSKFLYSRDTLINGMDCKIIVCNENEGNLKEWSESHFYINKVDSFLVGFENFVAFDGVDTIYTGVFAKNILINNRFDDRLLINKIATYKDVTFDSILNPPFEPASIEGDTIVAFTVSNLFDNKVKLLDTKNKVILLDFWYMSCYGCIKSYPTINKLHKEYKNNKVVEIYSVNPFDLDKKQQLKLRNYVKKYKMESNLVKMENQQFKYFQTNVYPTFYVLVDGVVKAIKIGSYDELYNELKVLIDEGLKQIERD